MVILLLILGIFCAIQAVRTPELIGASLWLAGLSAVTAVMLYQLGAAEVAVIELSVGAGLVTVLLVFAITMVGNGKRLPPLFDRRFLLFALAVMLLLVALTLPMLNAAPPAENLQSLTVVLWESRGLDVLAQIALIFAGVLGTLGLLSIPQDILSRSAEQNNEKQTEPKQPATIEHQPKTLEVNMERDKELVR